MSERTSILYSIGCSLTIQRSASRKRSCRAIVPPNTVKIDGDGKSLDRPQAEHSGASCRPARRTHPNLRRASQCRPYHCGSLRPRAPPVVAGGHGLCFPILSGHRGGSLCPRIRQVPGPPDELGPGTGRNYFHIDLYLVRLELILAGAKEGIKTWVEVFSDDG